jgi:hypothetical protein
MNHVWMWSVLAHIMPPRLASASVRQQQQQQELGQQAQQAQEQKETRAGGGGTFAGLAAHSSARSGASLSTRMESAQLT